MEMKSHVSLYRFLASSILIGVVPTVIAAMAVHWHFQRRLLLSQFDRSLAEQAGTLATLVEHDGEQLKLEFADEFMPQYANADPAYFFQVWGPDGVSLERSYSLQGGDLPLAKGTVEQPAAFDATLRDGRAVRCVGIEFPARISSRGAADPAGVVTIVVGADSTQLGASLRRGYLEIALTGMVSLAGITLFVVLALRRAVRLLRRIESEVERIAPDSLEQQIDEAGVPQEIRPIVSALNQSLQRIHGFVERERRFTADVAHELRTPIAELRASAEVALHWPDPELRQRLSSDALAISQQMGGLVEGLLELAVLESEEQSTRLESFDLVALLEQLLAQAENQLGPPRVFVRELPRELPLVSHRSLWEVALRNLIDNACSYSSPGATVFVRAAIDDDGARVRISNPTETLEATDVPRCRERLWRKNRHHNGTNHFGLGLSIVEAACTRLEHHLSIRFEKGVFHAAISRSLHELPSDSHPRGRPEESRPYYDQQRLTSPHSSP